MDRTETRLLLRVGIGAGFENRFHDLEFAASDSGVQSRNLQSIFRCSIHIGAGSD